MKVEIEDRELAENLMSKLAKLQCKCDWIGNDEIRRKIDEHLCEVFKLLKHGIEYSDEF